MYPIKDHSLENRIFLNRIIAAFCLITLLSSGLIIRLIYLQIVGNEHYSLLAKDNSIKIVPLVPTRGMIYDRNGKVLAENVLGKGDELLVRDAALLGRHDGGRGGGGGGTGGRRLAALGRRPPQTARQTSPRRRGSWR